MENKSFKNKLWGILSLSILQKLRKGLEEIDPDLDLDFILSNSRIISFRAFELLCN